MNGTVRFADGTEAPATFTDLPTGDPRGGFGLREQTLAVGAVYHPPANVGDTLEAEFIGEDGSHLAGVVLLAKIGRPYDSVPARPAQPRVLLEVAITEQFVRVT